MSIRTRILILLLIISGSTIHGQTLYIKAGPSFSNLKWTNSTVDGNTFKKGITGINAMFGLHYLNFKYFCLGSELGFIQKGGIQNLPVTDAQGNKLGNQDFKETINYLTLNTTGQLKIKATKLLEPYIYAGPRVDYLVSIKENVDFLRQFNDDNKLNKFSYGLIMGAGLNFHILKVVFGISGDYDLNFNKIVDFTSDKGVTNKISDKTFTVNVLIGCKL